MTIRVVAQPARLTWHNFRSVLALDQSDEEAQINPEMIFPSKMTVKKKGEKFVLGDLTVTVAPNRHNTLVVRGAKQTRELLEHEQGHFDILLLAARVMAKELETLEAGSPADLQAALEAVKEKHGTRAETIDDEYDTQTSHSQNTAQQRRWRLLIANALASRNLTALDGMDL